MRHEALVTGDGEGVVSLWCSCDETAIATFVGGYVAMEEMAELFVLHGIEKASDVLRP